MASSASLPSTQPNRPHYRLDNDILVLSEIYQEDVNLACWHAPAFTQTLLDYLAGLSLLSPGVQIKTTLPAAEAAAILNTYLPDAAGRYELVDWLSQCVDMFACLFDQQRVGVRFRCLDQAMCPRFHVDNLAVRLVHTLTGPATHWLKNDDVDREQLGPRSAKLSDLECGLIKDENQIQRLQAGDVALLKGSGWVDSRVPGLVHRSPTETGQDRWLLTLDLAD